MALAIGGDLLVTVVHLVLAGIAEAVLVGVFAIQRRLDVAALTLEGVGAVVVAHGVILVIVGQFVATDHALAVHHGISAVKGFGALLATDGADTPVMALAIGGDLLLVTVTDLLPMGGVGDALRNRCGEGLYFGVAIIPAVELEVLVRRGIGSCEEYCTGLVRIRDGLRSLIELAMLASLEGDGVSHRFLRYQINGATLIARSSRIGIVKVRNFGIITFAPANDLISRIDRSTICGRLDICYCNCVLVACMTIMRRRILAHKSCFLTGTRPRKLVANIQHREFNIYSVSSVWCCQCRCRQNRQ